jgi:hypothetical protein
MENPAAQARADGELRSLLQVLAASDGDCADPILRRELLDTGFVRRDAVRDHRLHLTPEGRRFLRGK